MSVCFSACLLSPPKRLFRMTEILRDDSPLSAYSFGLKNFQIRATIRRKT